jgi:DNA modification methylase
MTGKRHGRTWGGDIMRGEHPTLTGARPHLEPSQRRAHAEGGGIGLEPVRTGGRGGGLGGLSQAEDFDLSPSSDSTSFERRPINQIGTENTHGGTSIFDPVLAEMAYRWFSPAAGRILDPFAGGSVRGLVASRLGLAYAGIELSGAQIEANERQALRICRARDPRPIWYEGDALERLDGFSEGSADMILTCPPYGDLEIYSDDPRDISGWALDRFDEAMRLIIAKSARALAMDRFAIWVCSDYRLADGGYAMLPSKIRFWHRAAGLKLYNEAILLNVAGSLPIRAGKQFQASRKLGRMHQEMLIFLKGDEKAATSAMAPIDAKALDDAISQATHSADA